MFGINTKSQDLTKEVSRLHSVLVTEKIDKLEAQTQSAMHSEIIKRLEIEIDSLKKEKEQYAVALDQMKEIAYDKEEELVRVKARLFDFYEEKKKE